MKLTVDWAVAFGRYSFPALPVQKREIQTQTIKLNHANGFPSLGYCFFTVFLGSQCPSFASSFWIFALDLDAAFRLRAFPHAGVRLDWTTVAHFPNEQWFSHCGLEHYQAIVVSNAWAQGGLQQSLHHSFSPRRQARSPSMQLLACKPPP